MNLDFISNNTSSVLNRLLREKFLDRFTLVGGTALSIQIEHRLSEDLDFIFEGEYLDSESIKKFIDKIFKGKYKLIKQDNDHQLDFLVDGVKLTFFTTDSEMIPFGVKNYSRQIGNLNIASVDIISVMKINALAQRNTIRDYYDLYFISKYIYPLGKIYDDSRKLLPGLSDITYSDTIVYTDDIKEDSISEHLNPKDVVTKKEIANFFSNELKKIIKSN